MRFIGTAPIYRMVEPHFYVIVFLVPSLFVVTLGLTILHLGWPPPASVTLRLIISAACFIISPGAATLTYFSSRWFRDHDLFGKFLNVVIFSFSINLGLNIAIFIIHPALDQVLGPHLLVQFALLSVAIVREFKSERVASPSQATGSLEAKIAALIISLAFAALCYATYLNGYPLNNSEELIVITRLAFNSHIHFDNISFIAGEPSTYILVPFQLLIALVARLSGFEVSFVQSSFWTLTTIISTIAIAKLAEAVTNSRLVATIVAGLAISIALFQPNSFIWDAGIVLPYPNRYGVSSGILLPLLLWIFFYQLSQGGKSWLAAFSLVYLALDLTFVHARETLIAIGCISATGVFIFFGNSRNRRDNIKTIVTTLIAIIVILLIYQAINLALSRAIDTLVGLMKTQLWLIYQITVDQYGVLGSLFAPVPTSFPVAFGPPGQTIPIQIPSYETVFVRPWVAPPEHTNFGRLFIPLALLVLPIYVAVARSTLRLTVAAIVTVLALVTKSGGLLVLLSYLIGSPEVFADTNIVFIFCLIIVGDFTVISAAWLARRRNWWVLPIVIFGTLAAGTVAKLSMAQWLPSSADVIASIGSLWTPLFSTALHGVTLALLVYRLLANRRGSLDDVPQSEYRGPKAELVMASIAAAILAPTIANSSIWQHNWFLNADPPWKLTGNIETDFPALVRGQRFIGRLPLSIIKFLREKVPPNQMVIGGETETIATSTTHNSPIYAVMGQPISGSYVANWNFLRQFPEMKDGFDLRRLVTRESYGQLSRMVELFNIDLIIASPREAVTINDAMRENSGLRQLIEPIFSEQGFAIYRVIGRKAVSARITSSSDVNSRAIMTP